MTRSGVHVSDSAARPVLSRLSGAQPRRVARHEALIGLAAANSRVLFSSRGSIVPTFFSICLCSFDFWTFAPCSHMPGLVARVHSVIVWESSENAGPWNATNLATEARACDDLARCQSKKSAWLSFFVCVARGRMLQELRQQGTPSCGPWQKATLRVAAMGWVGDESSAACSDLY